MATNGRAGGAKTGGRKKGVPNKLTQSVRESILAAFDQSGGVDYLVRQADENPVAFMSLLGKVLPMQVTGENGSAIMIAEIRRVIVDPKNE